MTALKSLFTILLISFVWGCTESGSGTAKTGETDPEPKVNSQEKAAKALEGKYLDKSYLDAVEGAKSTWAARDKDGAVWGIYMEAKDLMGDSAFISVISIHEGGVGTPVLFDESSGHFRLDSERAKATATDISADFEMQLGAGGNLTLAFREDGKKLEFRKIDDYEYALGNSLIAGKYRNLAGGDEIEFSRDGKIKGMPDHKQYRVRYDFNGGPAPEMDALWFPSEKSFYGEEMHWRISGDTLSLYKILGGEPDYDYKLGELAYQLVRI